MISSQLWMMTLAAEQAAAYRSRKTLGRSLRRNIPDVRQICAPGGAILFLARLSQLSRFAAVSSDNPQATFG
jgi:hypothetical protein